MFQEVFDSVTMEQTALAPSLIYRRGRVDTSGHFFIVSNHKVLYDVAFRSSLGRFLACQKKVSFGEKRICVFIINVQIV